MEKMELYVSVHEGKRHYQRAAYIEDGWFIVEMASDIYIVHEIPAGGGEPQYVIARNSLYNAWKYATENVI